MSVCFVFVPDYWCWWEGVQIYMVKGWWPLWYLRRAPESRWWEWLACWIWVCLAQAECAACLGWVNQESRQKTVRGSRTQDKVSQVCSCNWDIPYIIFLFSDLLSLSLLICYCLHFVCIYKKVHRMLLLKRYFNIFVLQYRWSNLSKYYPRIFKI